MSGLDDDALRRMLADVERAGQRARAARRMKAFDACRAARTWPLLMEVAEPERGPAGSPDTHRDEAGVIVMRGYLVQREKGMPGVGGYAEVDATRLHERRVREHDGARWETPSAGRVHAARYQLMRTQAQREMETFWRRDAERRARQRARDTDNDGNGGQAA